MYQGEREILLVVFIFFLLNIHGFIDWKNVQDKVGWYTLTLKTL